MSGGRPRRLWLLVALASVGLVAGEASASPVTDALEAGVVGERFDGYLGIVEPPGSKEIRDLVESTNAARRAHYAEIAARNRIATEAVAREAARKLAQRAQPGTFLMSESGSWTRR